MHLFFEHSSHLVKDLLKIFSSIGFCGAPSFVSFTLIALRWVKFSVSQVVQDNFAVTKRLILHSTNRFSSEFIWPIRYVYSRMKYIHGEHPVLITN